MSVSPAEFWQLLQQSGLMSTERINRLRDKINARPDISLADTADSLTKLLVANKLLTRYQGQTLLQGLPGTFRIGPYTILEPDQERGAVGWFRVRDNTNSTELCLRYLADDEAEDSGKMPRELPNTRIETHDGKRVMLASPNGQTASGVDETPTVRISAAAAQISSRTSRPRFGVLGAVTTCLVLLVGAFLGYLVNTFPGRPAESVPMAPNKATGDSPPVGDTSAALWERPETGDPIQGRYLPAEVQAILHVRLTALTQHAEGDRILRSLGPEFDAMFTTWLERIGIVASTIKNVTVALLPQGTMLPKVVAVVRLTDETDLTSLPSYPDVDENRVARIATSAIWFPPDAQRTFVHGPLEDVQKLASSNESPVQFRSEFVRLLQQSDRADHLTIVANANFLSDEAAGLFPASRRQLLDGLVDFWSDEAQSISLQLQLTDVAVGELRVIPRAELAPRTLAARMKQRLRDLPARMSDYIGGLQLDPYWQRLALRFPTMVGFVAEQARITVEEQQVALTTVGPVEAIHNLLLASELSLASSTMELPETPLEDRSHWTLQDLLGAPTSIDMAQESLDAAVREIERQIREDFTGLPWDFRLEILGADLELEGITRNQQIRDFHQAGKTVAEVLTALVMAANPVKDVVVATETDQRLIWVPSQDGPGKIFVTTRNGAENRGLSVPGAFLSE